jgi:hypothetical protein
MPVRRWPAPKRPAAQRGHARRCPGAAFLGRRAGARHRLLCRPRLIASILAPSPTITVPATIWPVTRARASSIVAVMSHEPDGWEHGDGEVLGVRTPQGLAEIAHRDAVHDKIRCGKQQGK